MNSEYKTVAINQLVTEFINGTLPETKWTHRAHLIVCAHFLSSFEYYEAMLLIKRGIIQYNKAIGLENTTERGYHETLTLFWIWAVNTYLEDKKDWTLEDKINGLLDSPFSKKYLPFFFYSEDHLFTGEARAIWIEPDQRSLDRDSILSEYPSSIWYGDDQ